MNKMTKSNHNIKADKWGKDKHLALRQKMAISRLRAKIPLKIRDMNFKQSVMHYKTAMKFYMEVTTN